MKRSFYYLLLKIRFKCKRKKALKEITKNALLRQIRKELFQKCQNKRATVASILEKFLLVPPLIKQETDISKKVFLQTLFDIYDCCTLTEYFLCQTSRFDFLSKYMEEKLGISTHLLLSLSFEQQMLIVRLHDSE